MLVEGLIYEDKGRVRAAPSSVGQGRLCGSCGDPLCAPPWEAGWRDQGALEASLGSSQSQGCTVFLSTDTEENSSFPTSLEVSPWVAAALSRRGVPDKAWNPAITLSCGECRSWSPSAQEGSVCTISAPVPLDVMSWFLSRHLYSLRDGRNK